MPLDGVLDRFLDQLSVITPTGRTDLSRGATLGTSSRMVGPGVPAVGDGGMPLLLVPFSERHAP